MVLQAFHDVVGRGPSFAQSLQALRERVEEAEAEAIEARARRDTAEATAALASERVRRANERAEEADRARRQARAEAEEERARLRSMADVARGLQSRLLHYEPADPVSPRPGQMTMLAADNTSDFDSFVLVGYRTRGNSDVQVMPVPTSYAQLLETFADAWRDAQHAPATTALAEEVVARASEAGVSASRAKRLLTSARNGTLLP